MVHWFFSDSNLFVWTSDILSSVSSILDLDNGSFSVESSPASCVLATDVPEDGEVTFGEFNEVSSVSISFSAERLADSVSEYGTLIIPDSDMFVWTLDNVGSVLSVWEFINESFSFDFSTGSWVLAKDDSEDGEVSFGCINSVDAKSSPFSTDRLAESFSEDGTLIFLRFQFVCLKFGYS